MKPDEKRRFGVLDMMILVAAVAIGLRLSRWIQRQDDYDTDSIDWTFYLPYSSARANTIVVALIISQIACCLAAISAAFVVLRFRSPRPRRRRLMAQPGLVASLAVLAVLVFESALSRGTHQLESLVSSTSPLRMSAGATAATITLAHQAGLAVGLAWLVQVLVGRWRPEKSWVDRCGRAIGVAWLIVGIAGGMIEAQGGS